MLLTFIQKKVINRRYFNVVWTLSRNVFFSGKNLLRPEYEISTHHNNSGCPLRVDLSPSKKIIFIAHFLLEILSLEVQKIPCFWVSVQKWGFFRENIWTPQGGIWETKFFFRFFLSTSPINPKNVFLTFVFYFETWKYDFLIQNENFKFSFPLKSCVLW